MGTKPTYEELEHKVAKLEAQAKKYSGLELEPIFKGIESAFPMGITDPEGKMIYVNSALVKLWGYSHENEILGGFLPEYWEGDGIYKTIEDLMTKGWSTGEDTGKKKDGSLFDLEYVAIMCKDDTGKPVYMLGQFFDITIRKQVEKSSIRLRQRLESLWSISKISDSDLKTISDHVLSEVQKMTQSQYAFYGFLDDNEQIMTLHAWSHETMADCKTSEEMLHFPIHKAGIWAGAVRNRQILTVNDFSPDMPGKRGTPNGHVRLNRLMVVPLVRNGRVISIAAVANKKTGYTKEDEKQVQAFLDSVQILIDRKLAEQEKMELANQLQHAQKMESIGKLAGGIAHDFNNILHPMIGFAQMSLDDLSKDHPVHGNLQVIFEGARRAQDLVNRILLFARQKEPVMKPTQLKPIIEETLILLRSSIPSNIEIQQDLKDGLGHVLCDATEIHEIVMNLCTNAFHAMEDDRGTIKIHLYKTLPDPGLNLQDEEYICLSVSDDGTGIPPEKINRIFEPYYTTKDVGKGTGLGLSMVHGIVKKYRGNIFVERNPDKGTVFKVFLPVTSEIDTVVVKTQVQKPKNGNENILFVDDEYFIVQLGIKCLEKFGYSVTGVQDSQQALKLFKSDCEKYDLVITDMSMPVMVGTELAEQILQIRPEMPIIICSGFNDTLDREKIEELNIRAFIKKPILIEDLTRKVRAVLDQDASAFENASDS